jgi:hypothetical protein
VFAFNLYRRVGIVRKFDNLSSLLNLDIIAYLSIMRTMYNGGAAKGMFRNYVFFCVVTLPVASTRITFLFFFYLMSLIVLR